ncbi:PREDICTED: tyrosine-protein phosphatase non-receptor type substrate 1-like, partial [Tinamus guttatus]|uniref:tyrosine-protein phosphatase non-receptor type substrate 1-like n=1 Tax=Tinamus guttatus TaxID=94827 RepID=UPI00052F0291
MALPLARLQLLLLLPFQGARAQVSGSLQVLQSPEKVSVSMGKTLTLNCTVLESKAVGPVKWLKDSGGKNETVYDQKSSWPRVTRVVDSSNINYDINISNMQVEDAGTYYCVKFKKRDHQDEVLLSGQGTKVLVNGEWSPRPRPPGLAVHPVPRGCGAERRPHGQTPLPTASPVDVAVSGPTQRVESGSSATFTCTARGFFPEDIQVQWFKDEHSLSAPPVLVIPERPGSSFAMSSAVQVRLAPADVRARLSCSILILLGFFSGLLLEKGLLGLVLFYLFKRLM